MLRECGLHRVRVGNEVRRLGEYSLMRRYSGADGGLRTCGRLGLRVRVVEVMIHDGFVDKRGGGVYPFRLFASLKKTLEVGGGLWCKTMGSAQDQITLDQREDPFQIRGSPICLS